MRRRQIVLGISGSALMLPLAGFPQAAKVPLIGFLGSESEAMYARYIDGFRSGLRDLGYVEGKNIRIDYRWAEGKNDRLPSLAQELVRLKVDVIVTHGTPGTLAARSATTTI